MRRASRTPWVGGLALLVTLALPASASAGPQPAGSVRLSDGRTFAHWAHPERGAAVRRLPSQTSRRVAWIHSRTEDGFPEVYPVLRRFRDRDGSTWLRIRIPMRPNGRTGWVRDSALGPLYRVRTRLVVDRGRLRATLYRSGRRIWRSPIGVGKAGTATPAGHFWIREKFKVANPGGLYGPRAFGTGAYSRLSDWPGGGVIGIHGTNEPQLIPGRPSHGCIRVPNRAISRLYRLMPIGTPMDVR
jgi:L,D-transpeptidase catalytic domain